MNTALVTSRDTSEPLYRQLVSQVEKRLLTGELSAGDRLPSTKEFASQNNVSIQTAQNALKELNNRGIISRSQKNGTFISPNVMSRTIGILCGNNLLTHPEGGVYRAITTEAGRLLHQQGWNFRLYHPCAPHDNQRLFADIERDIAGGYLRGMFYMFASTAATEWLSDSCQLPWRYLGYGGYDTAEPLLISGLKYLTKQGFKSIDIVTSAHSSHLVNSVVNSPNQSATTIRLLKTIRRTLITAQNDPQQAFELMGDEYPNADELPEAIFVLNDNLCQGVVYSLIGNGYKIPDQVSILTHANKDLPIMSPVSLTRFEMDWPLKIQKDVDTLLAVLSGKLQSPKNRSERVGGPMRNVLIKGESCYEKN